MVAQIFITPIEAVNTLAQLFRQKRLLQNLGQRTLALRAGVSLSVLKKFESSGKISLASWLKLAAALGCLAPLVQLLQSDSISTLQTMGQLPLTQLFHVNTTSTVKTMDQLLKSKPRRRGRK
jgi:hypothetical protein